MALDEIRFVTVARKEAGQFFLGDPGKYRGIRNLVTVQVQDGEHRAITSGVQKFVGMPTGRQRTRLRLTVADDTRHNQIGVVKRRTVSVGNGITQFATFMNGTRRFRRDVAGNAARKRELLKQPLNARRALRDVWVDLAVGPFQIGIRHQSRPAVPRTGNVDYAQVVLFDKAVQMHINEVEPRGGSEVAQQPWLDMLDFERLLEQRVVHQIDLPHRKVIGCPPVSVHPAKLFRGEGVFSKGGRHWFFCRHKRPPSQTVRVVVCSATHSFYQCRVKGGLQSGEPIGDDSSSAHQAIWPSGDLVICDLVIGHFPLTATFVAESELPPTCACRHARRIPLSPLPTWACRRARRHPECGSRHFH